MAVGFGQLILFFVQVLNMFEVNGNSLERLQQYMEIEQEPKPVEGGMPPAYWPSSGELRVENLSARYSPVRIFSHHCHNFTLTVVECDQGRPRSVARPELRDQGWRARRCRRKDR